MLAARTLTALLSSKEKKKTCRTNQIKARVLSDTRLEYEKTLSNGQNVEKAIGCTIANVGYRSEKCVRLRLFPDCSILLPLRFAIFQAGTAALTLTSKCFF